MSEKSTEQVGTNIVGAKEYDSLINVKSAPLAKCANSDERLNLHASIKTKLDYLASKHLDYYESVLDRANTTPVENKSQAATFVKSSKPSLSLRDFCKSNQVTTRSFSLESTSVEPWMMGLSGSYLLSVGLFAHKLGYFMR